MARHRDIARIEPAPLGASYAVIDTLADPPWSTQVDTSSFAGLARSGLEPDGGTGSGGSVVLEAPEPGAAIGGVGLEPRPAVARQAWRGTPEDLHAGGSVGTPTGPDAGTDPAPGTSAAAASVGTGASAAVHGAEDLGPQRRLGEILGERIGLSPGQLDEIAQVASQRHVRYGDAAVALGRASEADVLSALAEQFRYPMAPRDGHGFRRELAMLSRPFSRQAEAVRALRNRLGRDHALGGEALRALAVVSADRGDGKTFLAANLAVALAQRGGRTVLVDADLRGPRQHQVFDLEPGTGLAGMLSGRADPQAIRAVHGVGGLFVLPAGQVPPNPLELVERPDFARLIALLKARFDHVIVDTPAARYGADALAIADCCGAALLLARRHASALAAVQALAGTLAEGPVRVAGLVVNEF
ncbi:MAG: hypothetical protein RLZ83_48 [Pseudomonadota bacterium]|jgi:chain length determinant protein tyrosine kinase EpsG